MTCLTQWHEHGEQSSSRFFEKNHRKVYCCFFFEVIRICHISGEYPIVQIYRNNFENNLDISGNVDYNNVNILHVIQIHVNQYRKLSDSGGRLHMCTLRPAVIWREKFK